MKSIDRLRKYGARFNNSHDAWSGIGTEILEFADEIEHDVDDMWHALTIDAKPMTDENMAKSGWVRLPVDADGVPIHVGDVMEADNGTTFEVEHISLYQWGWRCVGEGTDRSGVTCTAHAIPDGCRHHRAPTVEDVLREFADAWAEWKDGAAMMNPVETFAARLRLAGEE